jgi:hypothetical protein
MINVNTPQQNAAVFVGQNAAGGWDANMKFNTAQGGNFGIMSLQLDGMNIMLDNMEFIDGIVNDMDIKISPTVEF